MSDLHGPDDAADHPDIRALLAGLGADEPLPADVAARLDERLAALVDERSASGEPDTDGRVAVPAVPTLDRARERRRRWAPRLLAAATVAVIAGGIGVGIAQLQGGSVGTASSQSGSAAGANEAAKPGGSGSTGLAALPRLSRQHFHADARRLVASQSAFRANGTEKGATAAATPSGPARGSTSAKEYRRPAAARHSDDLAQVLAACGHRAGLPTGARAIPVRLDGEPATVVVVPRADGVAQVTAYPCSGRRVLATTTVPR